MKYMLYAKEVVYYMKEVDAINEEDAREKVFHGEIDFDLKDIYDGRDFEITDIEEVK